MDPPLGPTTFTIVVSLCMEAGIMVIFYISFLAFLWLAVEDFFISTEIVE